MEIQRQARFFIAALPIFGMRQDDQPPLQQTGRDAAAVSHAAAPALGGSLPN